MSRIPVKSESPLPIIFLCIVVALVLRACVPEPVHAANVEFMIDLTHVSDITTGPPFNDRPERWFNLAALGFTIEAGKNRAWEIDLAHGVKRSCSPCLTEQGSKLNVRFYPGRLR